MSIFFKRVIVISNILLSLRNGSCIFFSFFFLINRLHSVFFLRVNLDILKVRSFKHYIRNCKIRSYFSTLSIVCVLQLSDKTLLAILSLILALISKIKVFPESNIIKLFYHFGIYSIIFFIFF